MGSPSPHAWTVAVLIQQRHLVALAREKQKTADSDGGDADDDEYDDE